MGQLGRKLRSTETHGLAGIAFWCPACSEMHGVTIAGPNGWKFDGNQDAPTLEPSVRVRGGGNAGRVCHFFLVSGVLQFLGDCTHGMAGKAVALPDLPEPLRG